MSKNPKVSLRQLVSGFGFTGFAALAARPAIAQLKPQWYKQQSSSCQPVRPGGSMPVSDIEPIVISSGRVDEDIFVLSLCRKDLTANRFYSACDTNHTFYFQPLETDRCPGLDLLELPRNVRAVLDVIDSIPKADPTCTLTDSGTSWQS